MKNYKTSIETPYRLNKKKDIPIAVGSVALIVTGFVLKSLKSPVDSVDLANPDISHIPSFDLKAIHNYDHSYLTASNALEYTALAMPFISLVDKRVSGHAPQLIALYLETLVINTALYNITTGAINRRRPLTFNTDTLSDGTPVVPLVDKERRNVKESFYSGHTSTAAAATFFGAKIFTDLRPHSKLVPFVWGAAAIVPGFVGYSRYKAGKHFPSDVVTGYIVGASVGFLVPQLHKIDNQNLTLSPIIGKESGVCMVYTF